MPTNNIIANLFTTLFNTEDRRKNNCIVIPTSKLGMEVLKTLKNEGYIGDFEHIDDKRGGKFKIQLLAKITKCGAITPRFKVKKDEYNTWEQQFLPAYNRGILLVTTNQGVMSHKDAINKKYWRIFDRICLLKQIEKSTVEIQIPDDVKVNLKGSMLHVQGPLGNVYKNFKKIPVLIEINDNKILLKKTGERKKTSSHT